MKLTRSRHWGQLLATKLGNEGYVVAFFSNAFETAEDALVYFENK